MQHYKDSQNKVHELDEGVSPENIPGFPSDAVRITDEEAALLLAQTTQQVKVARIAAIDMTLRLIDDSRTRALSDVILALAAGVPAPSIAVQKLTDLEAKAVPLRAERKTLA